MFGKQNMAVLRLCLVLAILNVSRAALSNGGPTTFPYTNCNNAFPSCIHVSEPVKGTTTGWVRSFQATYETLTFNISSSCDEPFDATSACSQDVGILQFNTFAKCKWSKVDASMTWNGVTTNLVPTFEATSAMQAYVPDSQVLKISKLGLTYAMLHAAPAQVTFRLISNLPGERRCQSWDDLLNTTANPAMVPVAMALYSSNYKCCPVGPSSPPSPPPAPLANTPTPSSNVSCTICVTMTLYLPSTSGSRTPPLPNGNTCDKLAQSMTDRWNSRWGNDMGGNGRGRGMLGHGGGRGMDRFTTTSSHPMHGRSDDGYDALVVTVCAANITDNTPLKMLKGNETAQKLEFVDILVEVGYGDWVCDIELAFLDSCSTPLVMGAVDCSVNTTALPKPAPAPTPAPGGGKQGPSMGGNGPSEGRQGPGDMGDHMGGGPQGHGGMGGNGRRSAK